MTLNRAGLAAFFRSVYPPGPGERISQTGIAGDLAYMVTVQTTLNGPLWRVRVALASGERLPRRGRSFTNPASVTSYLRLL